VGKRIKKQILRTQVNYSGVPKSKHFFYVSRTKKSLGKVEKYFRNTNEEVFFC